MVAPGLALVVGCGPLLPESDAPEAFLAYLDERVPALMEKHGVPGVAVALVAEGRPVLVRGYGLADRARMEPVIPDTVFRVGSIAKPVTAWGVMRLVERGEVDLDAPVDASLSRWRIPPSPFGTDGVTVRRLLSHTAGVGLPTVPHYGPEEPLPSLEEALAGAPGAGDPVRLVAPPGSGFRYSGGGYAVLQLLVEEASGRPFEDFMREEVLAPLGMRSSTFDAAGPTGRTAARGYDAEGTPVPGYRYAATAAAGLSTSAADLGAFLAAMLPGPGGEPRGRGVLSPETLDEMLLPVPGSEEGGVAQGLGYFVDARSGQTVVGQTGSDDGWSAKVLVVPDLRGAIAVLTNADGGGALHLEVGCAWLAWATRRGVDEVCP